MTMLLFGCTVYDEDLLTGAANVEGAGGSSTEIAGGAGGQAGAKLPRGGTGAIATAPRGGTSGTATTTSTSTGQACQGEFLDGHCWYLGEDGASCVETCSVHGEYDPATVQWVGTESQGGSLDECSTLLRLVGIAEAPMAGYRTDGRGLGCIDYEGTPFWHYTPSFDPNDAMVGARLVCACSQ
jgi:hypothetical protein